MLCAKIHNYACLNLSTVSSLVASLIFGIMRSNEQLFPIYLLRTMTNVRHFKHTSLCSAFSKLKKLFQYICIMLLRRIFSFCLGRSHPSKGCAVVTSLWVKTKSGCFCDGSVVTEEDVWLAAEPSSRAVAFFQQRIHALHLLCRPEPPHLLLPVKSISDLLVTLLKARGFIRNFLGMGTLVRDNA